jgi:hypothetical protein
MSTQWQAVAVHEGYALGADEIAEMTEDDLYDVRVEIVRGTAAPQKAWPDELKMPGSYRSEDLVFEVADAETREEFERNLKRAEAMAAGLNAAGL